MCVVQLYIVETSSYDGMWDAKKGSHDEMLSLPKRACVFPLFFKSSGLYVLSAFLGYDISPCLLTFVLYYKTRNFGHCLKGGYLKISFFYKAFIS